MIACDVTWFGLGSTVFGWNDLREVYAEPRRHFYAQQFYVPSSLQGWLVYRIAVAGLDVLNVACGLPIELFSEVSNIPSIRWPLMGPGAGVVFVLRSPHRPKPAHWSFGRVELPNMRRGLKLLRSKRVTRPRWLPPARPAFRGALYGTQARS